MSKIEESKLDLSHETSVVVNSSRSKIPKGNLVGSLDPLILAEFIFFFFDLEEVCKVLFSVNKNWNYAYKMHMNVRIYLLSEETKAYEEVNHEIVKVIQ